MLYYLKKKNIYDMIDLEEIIIKTKTCKFILLCSSFIFLNVKNVYIFLYENVGTFCIY